MGRYKIREQQGLNYLTLTVVGWIDISVVAEWLLFLD